MGAPAAPSFFLRTWKTAWLRRNSGAATIRGFPHTGFRPMPQLARRIGRAKPSAIMQVAEKAKRLKAEGRDIISFSIGVPNFLPAEHVYAAAREALAKDSGQYGSNR